MKATSSADHRPTLSDVARLARVSPMTASYALRNNPKISRPTRERVQRAARKLHYVPDPEIGRLMHLLRSKRTPSYQATLGCLSFSHSPHRITHSYTEGVIAGACRRAAALGYTVDLFNIDHDQLDRARLSLMLKSRGIRGVLIPPLAAIEDCSQLLDWSQFSIVAATFSAQNLIVNRVVPHHQSNIMLAIARVRATGLQRLGLVLTEDLSRRVNFVYEAAFALHQQTGELPSLPSLKVDTSEPEKSMAAIKNWLQKFRPEIILTLENAVSMLQAALPENTSAKLCLLDHNGSEPFAGIDQHALIIGETAVDLLAGQVQRGEVGFEKHPRVTMVEGSWIQKGATVDRIRRPQAKRGKKI